MKRRKIIEPSCSADPSPKGEVDLRPLEGASAEAELAALAKAASHPIRVKILHMLARKNAQMCCHTVDELPLAQSTVSEHLKVLREAGLVQCEVHTDRTCYSISEKGLQRLKGLVAEL